MKNNNIINDDVIAYQLGYFDQFGVLPTNYIECTVTGNAFTCFGSNLKKKIEKYGSLENLLRTFTGKGAVKKTAQKTVETVVEALKEEIQTAKKKAAPKAKAPMPVEGKAK